MNDSNISKMRFILYVLKLTFFSAKIYSIKYLGKIWQSCNFSGLWFMLNNAVRKFL